MSLSLLSADHLECMKILRFLILPAIPTNALKTWEKPAAITLAVVYVICGASLATWLFAYASSGITGN